MKTYEEEFRERIQLYNAIERKKICDSETLRELLMQDNYKELLEKQHNIIAVNTQIIEQEKECWTNQWQENYGKADIQHLIDPTKRPESEDEEAFQKEELKRKIFHKWKREIRIKAHTKHLYYQERFNNPLDRDTRLTGMKILQVEYINEAFKKYYTSEIEKIERLKALEKIKHTLIGKQKQEYMQLKKEFEINHINI